MKKKVRLIFFIILAGCFFAFVYWITYRYTYEELQHNKLYDESQLKPGNTDDSYVPVLKQQQQQKQNQKFPDTSEKNVNQIIVTAKTTYILEKFDEMSGEISKEILPVPIELLGLDYDKVIHYTLEKSAAIESENSRLELVVFNGDLLVLRQTDEYVKREYLFFVTAEWGKIAVYKYQDESLYIKTDIKVTDIPCDLQEKIKEGMLVESEKELFMFLESYSS